MAEISRRLFVRGAILGAGATALASATIQQAQAIPAGSTVVLPEAWDYEADIVVVGYGGAGAMAAREAMAQGASCLVLEKCDEAMCGGSTCACHGYMFNNDTDAMVDSARGHVSREVIELIGEEGRSIKQWLVAHGLDEMQCFSNGGKYLYSAIKAAVDAAGAMVLYQTPAKQLICDSVTHEVYGVIAEDAEGNPVTCKANKGVLLASGCFLGNSDLVDRFIVSKEVGLITMGAPTCTGDGLLMGMAAGAAVKNLNLGGLEMCGPAGGMAFKKASEEIGCGLRHEAFGDYLGARIIVNQQGKRFMNEDKEFNHTKCNYEPFTYDGMWMAYKGYTNLPAYLIFDSQLMNSGPVGVHGDINGWAFAKDIYGWSEDNRPELERGWLVEADTLEDLVEKLAEDSGHDPIDIDGLKATIKTYNAYCADAYDPEFHRAEVQPVHFQPSKLQPLGEPPYYAAELTPCALYTIGGLQWGEQGCTLDWNGDPIRGLSHAGDVGQFSEVMPNGVLDCMAMGSYSCRYLCNQPPRSIPGEVGIVVETPSAEMAAEATLQPVEV